MNITLPIDSSSIPEYTASSQQATRPNFRAPQACNECKRRKGKCDRIAPECGLCRKYNRHCLYPQHSHSPLTRKHLTQVELRLQATTAELQTLRRKLHELQNGNTNTAPASSESSRSHGGDSTDLANDFVLPNLTAGNITSHATFEFNSYAPHGAEIPDPQLIDALATPESVGIGGSESPIVELEGAPTANADFDWNEQDIFVDPEWIGISDASGESGFVDGMASLSIDEKDTGFLGVASGAALLRLLQLDTNGGAPKSPLRRPHKSNKQMKLATSAILNNQPDPNIHIIDAMIDGYFRTYHVSYPIVHEPRFRAQHTEVIPRPEGNGWKALSYMIAAVGAFCSATQPGSADLALFHVARSQLSMDDLETGNISLVQALTLMSNYLQKRNKPNSGYNYLGLALRMAMGLGLHKEFPKWDISPLQMEIRRRVWWTLFVFDVGATITFGRPIGWPHGGIEVSLPLNIHDRHLTALTTSYPLDAQEITTYSAVRAQVTFHRVTNSIYTRVISVPFPSSQEMLSLDQQHIVPWLESLPPWYKESADIPSLYTFSHAVLIWRYHNLRLIMYRPFVIRKLLKARQGQSSRSVNNDDNEAYSRCLNEAAISIKMINKFWSMQLHTKLAAWYALYFLFQASLVSVFCLRNDPLSAEASMWRQDILTALSVIESMFSINLSSPKCYNTIQKLCGEYLISTQASDTLQLNPTMESPQTQISNVYSMMWPNAEADVVMQDDAWLKFLDELPIEDQINVGNTTTDETFPF